MLCELLDGANGTLRLLYLLEFLHVDVELATQLSFSVGEGGNLSTQCTSSRSLIVGGSALFLVLGSETLDLGVLATEETLVMKLTRVKLLANRLEFSPKPKLGLAGHLKPV